MNLADEFAASFADAAAPIATDYLLTNDPHSGVIRGTRGEGELLEPGIKPVATIVIVEPVANFTRAPDPAQSEIVQVLAGQFAGKWVLVGCVVDNANYTLTCEASE